MTVGQTIAIPQPQGLTALTVVAIQPQPVALAQAQTSIEQLLWNQKKREAVQAETKALRTAAHITYLGNYAPGAVPAAAGIRCCAGCGERGHRIETPAALRPIRARA